MNSRFFRTARQIVGNRCQLVGFTNHNALAARLDQTITFPPAQRELSAGNVHQKPMSQIYRETPLFRALRNPDLLKGKCGRCRFRAVCGGPVHARIT